MAVSGVIISTLCSAIAAAALYRLGGPWAAVAWLFAPTAVFTTVPYTESLFCAAAFWAWERARSDRWLAAAVLASIACTVRVSGVFLVGALLVMIISDRIDWHVKISRAGLMLIPAAVIAGFVELPLPADRQLDRLVPRPVDRLGPRPDLAVGLVQEHHPGDRAGRLRRSPVVGRRLPWRGGLDGGRTGCDGVVPGGQHPRPPFSSSGDRRRARALGGGQLGGHPGGGVLPVVLVLLGQPRHPALVPAVDHDRSLGGLAARDRGSAGSLTDPWSAWPSPPRSC